MSPAYRVVCLSSSLSDPLPAWMLVPAVAARSLPYFNYA